MVRLLFPYYLPSITICIGIRDDFGAQTSKNKLEKERNPRMVWWLFHCPTLILLVIYLSLYLDSWKHLPVLYTSESSLIHHIMCSIFVPHIIRFLNIYSLNKYWTPSHIYLHTLCHLVVRCLLFIIIRTNQHKSDFTFNFPSAVMLWLLEAL